MYSKKKKKENLLTLSKYVPQSGEQFGNSSFVLFVAFISCLLTHGKRGTVGVVSWSQDL